MPRDVFKIKRARSRASWQLKNHLQQQVASSSAISSRRRASMASSVRKLPQSRGAQGQVRLLAGPRQPVGERSFAMTWSKSFIAVVS